MSNLDRFIHVIVNTDSIVLTDFQSQPEYEGTKLEGQILLVEWNQIQRILSKCQRESCGKHVLPDNMDISKKG